MLVVMHLNASQQNIDAVAKAIESMGLQAHPLPGSTRTAIGITGNITAVDPNRLASMEGVLREYEGLYTHIPHVPHERLRTQYGRSSVFVLPSVEDGFGYVTAEAMGCGLPVIVSSSAGSADIVSHGKNGFVVPPRSPEAIQEALESLLRDPELRASMAECSLSQSRDRYRWEDYAERMALHHRALVG